MPDEKEKEEEKKDIHLLDIPKQATAQSLTYVIAAFGLVAALAWNEAIKALINKFFIADGNIISLFIYAVIVTLVAVLATSRLNKLTEQFNVPKE